MTTLEQLKKKYNLGVKLDSEGRFYTGNNRSNFWKEARESNLSTASFLAKKVKQIVKKEFGITISAKGKCHGLVDRIDIVIKAEKNELFKPFEEISKNWMNDDYQTICRILHGHSNYGRGFGCSTNELLKNYYEKYLQNRYDANIGLNEKYELIINFIELLLRSYNYNHTGANMGDCDYIDADFFSFIKVQPTDRDENLLYELDYKIYNATSFEELEQVLKN